MRRTFVKSTFLSIALLSLVGAAQAEWVLFEDSVPGDSTQTAANANTFDMRTNGGPYTLKDFATGTTISGVTMSVGITGGALAGGTAGGNPNSGSPLYNVFNGKCYFGSYSIPVSNYQTITVTLSGLNPAKRYKLQAGSVRGGASYSNRWVKCNLAGVDGATANHQKATDSPFGIISSANEPTLMTGYEVAYNSGWNVSGDMIEWDDIQTGMDGSFSFTSTQWYYNTAVASHGINSGTFTPNSGSYGYAIDAFRLEEIQGPDSAPVVMVQPVNQTNILGSDVTFTVAVSGNNLKYQWRKDGNPIANATNQNYTVSNLTATSQATYSVAVTNTFGGVVSSGAFLKVLSAWPIEITTQPQSVSTVAGQPVTFSVVVTGTSPQYQWMKAGTLIANATNANYTIQSVMPSDEGTYSVRITNLANSVTSSVATLVLRTGSQALFVARTNLSAADKVVTNILTSQGFIVIVTDDRNVTSSTVASNLCLNKSLVVIASSADPASAKYFAGSGLAGINVPMVTSGSDIWSQMQLCSSTYGKLTNQTSINIVDSAHPIAAGLSGLTQVYQNPQDLEWGIPGGNAIVIAVATNTSGNELPVLFGYERNARNLSGGTVSSRRVGVFLGNNSANSLSTSGINLFKAAVNWATSAPITNAPVGISRQPFNISIPEGSPAFFSVNATGAVPYYFMWQRNGATVYNGYNRLYTVNYPTPADNGAQFSVIVTNRYGRATSEVAVLTVLPPLPIAITQQPANRLVDLGQNATFSVAITGTAPYYQWYHNSTAIPGANTNIYMVTGIDNSDLGDYYVVITNRAGKVTSSTAQLKLYPAPVTLLGWNTNNWHFYTNYTDLGSGWTTNGYNDGLWPVGSGIFMGGAATLPSGYTAGTTIPLTTVDGSKIVTWYFRNSFNFTNTPEEITLSGASLIDDGAVFYLNGKEISRDNMPSSSAYNTWASSSIGNASVRSFSIDPYQLRQGNNTFAVEVHQGSQTSGDSMMGVELTLSYIRPTTLDITNQPRSITIEEGNDTTFTVGVSGLGAKYQWYKDGTAISGATKPTYTITNAAFTSVGNYYVTASNYLSFLTSETAYLTVTTNTSLPTLVSADGTATNTQVLVTFSEPLLASTANVAGNYVISNITARTTLTVSSAVLTNRNQVLLTSAARTDFANYILVVKNVCDAGSKTNKIADNSMIPIVNLGSTITWTKTWTYYDPYWAPDCFVCEPVDRLNQQTAWRYNDFTVPDYWTANTGLEGVFWYPPVEIWPPLSAVQLKGTDAATAYFRTYFNSYGIPAGGKVQFRFVVDSGAVFYINGQEFYRYNMPSGEINYQTVASANVNPTVSDWIDVPTNGLAALVMGNNLMAVELHQRQTNGVGSRAFGMEMQMQYNSLPIGRIVFTTQPTNTTVFEGQPVTFKSLAVGASSYQWYSNTVAISGATNATFVVPLTTAAMSNSSYYVIAKNATDNTQSSTASLYVTPDTRAPEITSAAIGTGNTISINFSRSLSPDSATNLNNYNYSCGTLVSAILTNGTNVILTALSQPTADCTIDVAYVTGPGATNPIACGTTVALTDPATVSILDWRAPIITGCPAAFTTNSGVVTWTAPTAVDYCSGVVVPVICYPPSGSTITNTTLVTCNAQDAAGNPATCGFIVTVQPPAPIPLKYSVNNTNNTITLSWTNNPANFVLQTCTNLGSANLASSATWVTYTGTVTTINNTKSATFTRTNTALFFRLNQQ